MVGCGEGEGADGCELWALSESEWVHEHWLLSTFSLSGTFEEHGIVYGYGHGLDDAFGKRRSF